MALLILGIIHVIIFVPETKDMTLGDIQEIILRRIKLSCRKKKCKIQKPKTKPKKKDIEKQVTILEDSSQTTLTSFDQTQGVPENK